MALKIQRSIVFMKGPPCEAGAEQLKAQLSVLDEPTLPPGGVLPRILDRGVPRRFVNPNPI